MPLGLGWTPGQSLSGMGVVQGSCGSGCFTHSLLRKKQLPTERCREKERYGGQNLGLCTD